MSSQTFATSQTIPKDGQYLVCAVRTPSTDLLSVYVNRVKKLFSDGNEVSGSLSLESGDVIESTGELAIQAK